MNKFAKFKLNNGSPVLLCSQCSTIIKKSLDFNLLEYEASIGKTNIKPQYCAKCK